MAKQTHSERYERVRKEFEDMSVQDRAVFLVEATVSTIARGIERAGEALADELDKAFRWEPASEGAAPASEPPSGATGASSSTTGTKRRPSSGTTPGEGHIET